MKRLYFLALLFLLLPHPARAMSLYCGDDAAKKAASANEEVKKFCSGAQYHGCDYKAAHVPERDHAGDYAWTVTASIIHSFDEKGQPVFMPEGFIFANVSESCKVTKVFGNAPVPPATQEEKK